MSVTDRKLERTRKESRKHGRRRYRGLEADVFKLEAELRNVFDQDYEVQTMHVSSTTCKANC